MALFCQLAIGLLLLCGLPRAPGRHVDDAVLPVGRAMTRSRGKVVSGQFSSHTETNGGKHEKPRLASTASKSSSKGIHDAFPDSCTECTTKIPSSDDYCRKKYDFGIEAHVVHKNRSGYAIRVSRIYKNIIDERVLSRTEVNIRFISLWPFDTVNKQLPACHCPLLQVDHTYAVFGFAKSGDSRQMSVTLGVVLEIPRNSKRQIRKKLKKLTATTCPTPSSNAISATESTGDGKLKLVLGHQSTPRQKYTVIHR